MTLSGQNASSQLTAPEPGAQPIHCVRCGYDLRGTDSNSRCPECGLKAYWSLRAPEQLSQYPAGWVASMAWGVRLLAITYGGAFALWMLLVAGVSPPHQLVLGIFFGVLFPLLQLVGTWLLARSSKHWSEPSGRLNRFLLRGWPLIAVVGIAISLTPSWVLPPVPWSMIVGIYVSLFVAPAAIFFRLRAVARIISNTRLAEHSVIVGWGFALTCLAFCGFMALQEYHRDFGKLWAMLLALVISTALLLFVIWGTAILIACMIDFGRAAKVARAQWRADAARE